MDQSMPQLLKLLDHVRAQKDATEIFYIANGANIMSDVFRKLKNWLTPGVTERQAALFLEQEMSRLGVRELAFCPIVASGKNSAHIHHWPTDKKIKKGEQVMIDFGAVVHGYCSDMTRMLFMGRPNTKQEKIYNAVLKAQGAGISMAKSGAKGGDIDVAARKILARFKLGSKFTHNLGHGVGRYIHEWPRLGKKSTDVLRAGMVVTIEPGVYISGWGGIRIEDMVHVSSDGPKVLTQYPKNIKDAIVEI